MVDNVGDASMGKLHEVIKDITLKAMEASKPSGIFYGTVVSVSPLKIQVEQKMIIESDFLVLTSAVQDFTVNMTVEHLVDTESSHVHPIYDTYTGGGRSGTTGHAHTYRGTKSFRVLLGLKKGERVILLRAQGGQQFIVLDRVR